MNAYIALCIQILTFATLLAGSAIALLYVYHKYGKSLQLIICAIVSVWVTLVVNVILSIFGLRTILDELIAHPIFTALLIVTAHIIILAHFATHATVTMRVVSLCSWLLGIAALNYLCPMATSTSVGGDGETITGLFLGVGAFAQIIAQAYAEDESDEYDEDSLPIQDSNPAQAESSPISVLTDITKDCLNHIPDAPNQ